MTHFERLGLPGRFDLAPADLERAYLTASRAVHPDHHAGGADATAAVNAAYQTLRDPLRRAEYLYGVRGGPAVAQQDPAFLMETMDLRERAEAGEADAVGRELAARLEGLFAEFARHLASDDLPAAGRVLAMAKTLRSLSREVG